MRLTMSERRSVVKATADRYRKASKKGKMGILNEFIELTGYNRCYGSYVLRNHGRKIKVSNSLVVIGDATAKKVRRRDRTYDDTVVSALKKIWFIMDCICGKRLAPALKDVVAALEKHREIHLDPYTREKLLAISPATIDRLLKNERKQQQIKGRSNTKPGTMLKHQIPIRTFSEWNEQKPGFTEMDLVAHEGGDPFGDFIQTLDVTDVYSGWTETQAVKNKAQVWVFAALKEIQGRLPFDLLGVDSDNGSEFINDQLYQYCLANKITFTRGRKSKKNDNCFVEQKNYSVVRRAVGYLRYDTERELLLINELYGYLRLYTNYFQPAMKLIEKTRDGSKVTKKYDIAQTPCKRLLLSPDVSDKKKALLKDTYAKLNPADLKRKITALQNNLVEIARKKKNTTKRPQSFVYISREATNHQFV